MNTILYATRLKNDEIKLSLNSGNIPYRFSFVGANRILNELKNKFHEEHIGDNIFKNKDDSVIQYLNYVEE